MSLLLNGSWAAMSDVIMMDSVQNLSAVQPGCLLNFIYGLSAKSLRAPLPACGRRWFAIGLCVNKAELRFRMWENTTHRCHIKPTKLLWRAISADSTRRIDGSISRWLRSQKPLALWLDHIVSSVWDPAFGFSVLLLCSTTYWQL